MRTFFVLVTLTLASAAHAQMGHYYNQNSYGNNSFGGSGYGTPSYGYEANRYALPQAPAAKPEDLVREGIEKLQAFMRGNHGGDSTGSLRFIEQVISPYFDFDYMAKWAAGPRWRYLSQAQRTNMSDTLRSLFLAALARNLTGYGNPRVIIRNARKGRSAGEINVPVSVIPSYGRGVRITMSFRFYKSSDGWKVFDVTANNTSAVMYYRRYFNQRSSGYGRY